MSERFFVSLFVFVCFLFFPAQLDFVELTRDNDLEVRFIEFMPFDSNRWSDTKMLSYSDMVSRIRDVHPTFARLPAEPNETSKTWSVPGFKGRVGFITSMSEHFCSTCNRLRITADGQLKVCLFGAQEVSLRDAIREGRSDEELGSVKNTSNPRDVCVE